jgi:hypothetical protein
VTEVRKMTLKDVGIPIITAVIASLIGGSAIINLFVSAFYTPNVNIEIISNKNHGHESTVSVNNRGSAPATNVLLTVETPANISYYKIFSTENHTEKSKLSSNELQIYMPRLIHGQGSMVRINTVVDEKSNVTLGAYTAYITYDQGSSMLLKPVLEKPQSLIDQIRNWYYEYAGSIWSIWGIGIALGIPIVMNWVRKRRKMESDKDVEY